MAKRKPKLKGVTEAPMASCLLLCDDVVDSLVRGKHSLVGVIDGIAVPSLPFDVGPFAVYLRLSNVYAKQQVEVKLIGPDDAEIMTIRATSPSRQDPLESHTLTFMIPNWSVEIEGRHRLIAAHDGVPFAQSPVFVKLFAQEEPEDVDDSN